MELQKKPSLILRLKSIIQSQRKQCVLLRDLEKEVGFVQKWNFMGIIEKYPTIFCVTGGNGTPPMVMLTEKADKIALEEDEARVQMEPILVKNLRKLLMLSVDCTLPLETIQLIENDLGLPNDFRQSLIPKYPQFFSVKDVNGRTSLQLENWDSFLAVTAREERLACEGVLTSKEKVRVLIDGNYFGPFAFQMHYPAGFRPNMNYLKEVQKWQKMEFPSPYLNAKRFELADPKAQKRVVAVLHELLSLTMEKRLTSAQIDAFHSELRLPARLLLCLIKQHSIFYITNKGAFERRRYMNVVVQRARHPELQQYIHSSVNGLLSFIQKGLVERVAVIFSDSNNVPIERFVFKINVNQSYGSKLEEADLEFSLKSFLIKLPLSQSLMKVLPPDCRWEITAYFHSLPQSGTSKDAEIWVPTDTQQWQQAPLITPIKSMSCEPLGVQLYLEHPSLSEPKA
uniref:HORMA domain-containing protein n=1 Tax=Solanum tuberosum TaxID=4113 RepID=M1B3R9_SOLTU